MKEYSLPILVSLVLLLLFGSMYFLRATERASLADWFYGIAGGGDGYTTLLSQDKTDEFKRNESNGEPVPPQSRPNQPTPSASPGAFTVNPSGSLTSNGGGTTTPTTPPSVPAPFSASISYFQQDSESMVCVDQIVNKNRCSKRYVFGAGVRTLNGPGAVSYTWQSNLAAASQSGGFSAGGGEANTPLQKTIEISCRETGNYTLQIVITSPTQTQSGVLPINHNCNL